MEAYDSLVADAGYEAYWVGPFEDSITELGIRVAACDVEENDGGWTPEETVMAQHKKTYVGPGVVVCICGRNFYGDRDRRDQAFDQHLPSAVKELAANVFPISAVMPPRQWSIPYEELEHHVRFRERRGEPGVTAVCDNCPEWATGLSGTHDLDDLARLESQHTGVKVTIVREAA